MKWHVIVEPQNLLMYWQGLVTTMELLLASLAGGAILALMLALLLTGPWRWARWLVSGYTYTMRGTPLLLQVYLIYYGLGQVEWIQARWDEVWPWTYFKEPFFCALLSFTLNTAAYTAEMLAGAIRETPAGEIEAAHAYGMPRWKVMLRIVLPSAMRRCLPAYSNEVIMMLQSTSLASAVPSMLDITAAASRVYSDYFLPFEAYMAAALIYLLVTFVLMLMFRWAEKRWLAFQGPRNH
ncbi:ABC transporter permease subunit [Curvibacter sp. CHRR-16]|uniref:ABC transporter permease n=1 Tax=Curvibacter sp. CHRR-16 TaxID=2835872 RepID=UPI001BD9E46E|nr:ABC transporter permease subunit [Curvibacter sp. CHRR-16]MBT0571244.1 ABC transporter permease subunit [Curvibacter sp. CHRR-16]